MISPGVCGCGEQLPPTSGPSHACKVFQVIQPMGTVAPGTSVTFPFPPPIPIISWQPGDIVFPLTQGTLVTPEHLCPDLLRYEQIGAADGLRGRLVRAFFWLLRAWPPR